MQTHVKESVATVVACFAIAAVIHAGIWFNIFGTTDVTVLGFPFHYFWLVAGGPAVMFVLYWLYYQFVTTTIMEEKEQMNAEFEESTSETVSAQPGDSDD